MPDAGKMEQVACAGGVDFIALGHETNDGKKDTECCGQDEEEDTESDVWLCVAREGEWDEKGVDGDDHLRASIR